MSSLSIELSPSIGCWHHSCRSAVDLSFDPSHIVLKLTSSVPFIGVQWMFSISLYRNVFSLHSISTLSLYSNKHVDQFTVYMCTQPGSRHIDLVSRGRMTKIWRQSDTATMQCRLSIVCFCLSVQTSLKLVSVNAFEANYWRWQKREHTAANRASVIRQALCRSHARFTCTLEDTSRNVPKALISGGSNNRKLFICSLIGKKESNNIRMVTIKSKNLL